ncbi:MULTISPECIES: Bug family tripartite tricarboxylate transporter substrate binding protein [Ramlibacter]|uniref:Tripartite tricarboxylate transporter substrate binding protein n=1 Tax=Ramlibacter pinisoli TaxID=2682844 RepID=A0A6N8IZ45_9BURK|nr:MULTISPECIES: tripartite tricarboxylate transporter substrate binding protein [Ramlibacter]MBA2962367.1 tripartite tricarboxylate transporter substrate binding protein [Ramlibacter sp. CGMCC 1.13660]MVQ32309.1 tripartite tricarboxylate transporter substrate binding protein [Ramlibacter pinisoli]
MNDSYRIDRRRLLGAGAAAGALWAVGLPSPAQAQGDYPSRTIKIVVPYSAGTGSDALARTVAQGITEKTGKTVVVENREGGGSLIGTMAVVKAPADGYTILIAANPMVIVPAAQSQPQYNPTRDLVPVAKVAVIPLVLATTPSLGFKTLRDLIAYAKANPGKLSYGSSGPGTSSQQEMEVFKQAAGIDIAEVPYKSTAQAMTDLIGGTLTVFPVVVPLVSQHIQSGRATALAVLDVQRSQLLPDVPAVTEQLNAPGYVPSPVWYGFVAPTGTPAQVVNALSGMINAAMETNEAKTRLTALGAQRIAVSNEQFATDVKIEYDKAGALARKLGTFK